MPKITIVIEDVVRENGKPGVEILTDTTGERAIDIRNCSKAEHIAAKTLRFIKEYSVLAMQANITDLSSESGD